MSSVTVVNYNERPLLQIDESMILRRMTNSENSKKIDFVWVEINGKHKKRRNSRSDKIYIVKNGELDLIIDDGIRTLKSGDIGLVPANEWCELVGRSAVVGIACSPAFDVLDDEISE